jgi:hypothetical protein
MGIHAAAFGDCGRCNYRQPLPGTDHPRQQEVLRSLLSHARAMPASLRAVYKALQQYGGDGLQHESS